MVFGDSVQRRLHRDHAILETGEAPRQSFEIVLPGKPLLDPPWWRSG